MDINTAEMTDAATESQSTAPLRLFWQPGCSSCVKLKEYLAQLDVPFQSVNILAEKGSMDELMARGIRSVPVLIQGERILYGQSLNDVAAFVGKKRDMARLPPMELAARWLVFMKTARTLITKVPADKLDTRPVPERNRSICALAYHIFQIPESFLMTIEAGIKDSRDISNAVYDHLKTTEDLLNYADPLIERMERWSETVKPAWFETSVETYYGEQPTMQILERGTWHSGQHTRQLDFVVTQLTGEPALVPPATYVGLPMPEGLWT